MVDSLAPFNSPSDWSLRRDFPSTKEKESGVEEDSKGAKEEGELDDDGTADNNNAVQTSNADEEEEEELLKSAKMENDGADDDDGGGGGGEGSSDTSWMDREITRDLLHVIAKQCNGKIYRKLG